MHDTRHTTYRLLARLRTAPPGCLLFEGGDADARLAAAMHWAKLVNCEPLAEAGGDAPCGSCGPCVQIGQGVFADLVVFDTREGNVPIEELRRMRMKLGEPPRGNGLRVVVLAEVQDLRNESANLMLKSLEEPRPGNVFVLTAPQRERILPTLVSRSFVMTLPWPRAQAVEQSERMRGYAAAFLEFLAHGRGWFEKTSSKGGLDRQEAYEVVAALERLLIGAMADSEDPLARALAQRLGPAGLRRLQLALDQVRRGLDHQVTPALCLDWLAASTRVARTAGRG